MNGAARALLLLAALALAGCGPSGHEVTSTLIVNARVHDGTGAPAMDAKVRIDGDRIVSVGQLDALDGETVIDAAGLVLAPGFIDPHSHHDSDLADYRSMPAVLSQGVTTIVRGVDGFFDVEDGTEYEPVAKFNRTFEARPAAVNIASYSPHGSIRAVVMGKDYRRESTASELDAMRALVDADMRNGALGLASGLEYEPGIYSSTAEVIELARVAAKYGGTYSTHMRDEDDRIMESIDEVIEIALNAGIAAEISHIKLADLAFWGRADEVIDKLEAAVVAGATLHADIYPYLRWQSNLAVLFPGRDYTNAATARYTFEHTATPDNILLVGYPPNADFENRTLADIAAKTGRDPVELLLTLAGDAHAYREANGGDGSSIIAKGMSEADVVRFMQWRYTSICSDGSHESGHPRGHGSFPRVLGRYVREQQAMTLATAIHKMTGLTAGFLGLKGRGTIEPGAYADLVLFDPTTIIDGATMEDSTAMSAGIQYVWVNGTLAFSHGQVTGQFAGRIVKPDSPAADSS